MIPVKLIYMGTTLALAALFAKCTKIANPLDQEQYQKSVYIVGANQTNNQGLQAVNLPYTQNATDTTGTYISAATGGSLLIDRAVTVNIAEAGADPLAMYNSKYLYKPTDVKYRLLGAPNYTISSYDVQINAGTTYGTMPIGIKTYNLQCDSLYALTFRINSVSNPNYIQIRPTDSVLIFSFNLYNNYSGNYQETGRYYKIGGTAADTTSLALGRNFKAVNYSTCRFFHLTNSENQAGLDSSGVTVKVNTDNSLTVNKWGSGPLVTTGGGIYNATNNSMYIWYNFTRGTLIYRFEGTFMKQ